MMYQFKNKMLVVTLLVAASLVGCNKNTEQNQNTVLDSADNIPQAVSVAAGKITLDTTKGAVDVAVNPSPVAVYDMTVMQNLNALGVVADGLPGKLLLDTMKIEGADYTDVGTIFEPNLEVLNKLSPQAIIIGGRMADKYSDLSAIAPTLDLSLDQANLYESSKQRLSQLGQLFDKTDKATQLQAQIDTAISDTKAATKDKGNGLVIVVNGNKMSAQSQDSRFGFIHKQFGIPAADTNIKTERHGQPVSFEYLQKINPDWLFVLDRTAAIGEEGEGAARVLDNDLVKQTTAGKNNQIVYLSPDSYLGYGSYHQWMKDTNIVKTAFENAK